MWVVGISQVEAIANEIEKKLFACGHHNAATIVRCAFAEARECVFIPDVSKYQKCDLRVLSTDGLEHRPDLLPGS